MGQNSCLGLSILYLLQKLEKKKKVIAACLTWYYVHKMGRRAYAFV